MNDWFALLEAKPRLEVNGDAYIGAARVKDGVFEYWIGMFYPIDTESFEGFEAMDMDACEYAVCYLYEKESSREFYTAQTHQMCLAELEARGLQVKEGEWRFERYNCPRFTTPDEKGNVILDYALPIEG